MIIRLFTDDPDDPMGPFGPEIRKFIPDPEPYDEDEDVDGGQHDQQWYWPRELDVAA